MPKVKFMGPGASYTLGSRRFERDAAHTQDVSEDEARHLLASGKFKTVREAETAPASKKGGLKIKGAETAGDPKDAPKPEFPAEGFKDKRALKSFARKHLTGYEPDLNKALKTLNAEAAAKYNELYVKPAEAASEETPEDLFDEDELNTDVQTVQIGQAGADDDLKD